MGGQCLCGEGWALWFACGLQEHSRAGEAELERKVMLAFLNRECVEYRCVVSSQGEHTERGIRAQPRAARGT